MSDVMIVSGIVLPVTPGDKARRETVDTSRDGLRRLLNAWTIQVIDLGSTARMIVNEDIEPGTPGNGSATRVVEYYNTGFTATGRVHGPAVVVGVRDGDGFTDVPDDIADRILGLTGVTWPPRR